MTDTENQAGSGYADELREHEFDGIQEFDNHLPGWWLWTFYLACIFSLFYWLHFHVLQTGDLPTQAYEKEMALIEAREAAAGGPEDEKLLAMAADAEMVAAGKQVFATNCVACHQASGASLPGPAGIGPNLTDKFWIHGGSPTQIHHTVTNGVPGTAMVAWGAQLGRGAVDKVVAYVLTLRNTDVPGKEPQGDPYEGI